MEKQRPNPAHRHLARRRGSLRDHPELCLRNKFRTDIYVRPMAYKSAERIGVNPDSQDSFAIVALEGTTRDSILELASRELRLETVERSIDRSELYVAEEAFFTGTAVGVGPIVKIDHRAVAGGEITPRPCAGTSPPIESGWRRSTPVARGVRRPD